MAEVTVGGMTLIVCDKTTRHWPKFTYEEWPDHFCGAGNGLGEKIVPDYIFSAARLVPEILQIVRPIKLSPACLGHDMGWKYAQPTWEDFHARNAELRQNLRTIILAQTKPGMVRDYALKYADTYGHSVDTIGRKKFWTLKRNQNFPIPISARWLLR